jgi:hypothetical protein
MNQLSQTPPETPSEPAAPQLLPEDGGALELLKNENARLRSIVRDAAAHRQITAELQRAGARDAELLFAAVRSELQFADDDNLANAAAIVDHLRRTYPQQFGPERPAQIDAAAGLTAPPRLSKEALAKMTPAEIAKLDWDTVREILAR